MFALARTAHIVCGRPNEVRRLNAFIARCALTFPTFGGVWSAIEILEKTQWSSPDRLANIQLRRLKELLSYARRNIPYYRTYDPSILDVRELQDLARIPVLTRREVRRNFASLRSPSVSGQLVASGGSTGSPVFVRKSSQAFRMESAAQYRAYRWAGFNFGQRHGYMFPVLEVGPLRDIRMFFGDALLNRVSLDTFQVDTVKLRKLVRSLGTKPVALLGSPSALLLLAKFVKEGASALNVRTIISQAEQLLQDERRHLTEVFGADVYDFYGAHEVGSIAAECTEKVGHHVTSENIIVEIIGRNGEPAPDGEVGSIVITDLNNYAMPLIRYQIGDQASRLGDECPCRRGLPLLRSIEGRITDVITTPDERFMCISTFGHRVLYKTHVEQFQIHQHSKNKISIHVVLAPEWREREGKFIQKRILGIVGDDVKVEVEFHDALELGPTGKRRLVKSDILPRRSE